jgi:hypothetical protein
LKPVWFIPEKLESSCELIGRLRELTINLEFAYPLDKMTERAFARLVNIQKLRLHNCYGRFESLVEALKAIPCPEVLDEFSLSEFDAEGIPKTQNTALAKRRRKLQLEPDSDSDSSVSSDAGCFKAIRSLLRVVKKMTCLRSLTLWRLGVDTDLELYFSRLVHGQGVSRYTPFEVFDVVRDLQPLRLSLRCLKIGCWDKANCSLTWAFRYGETVSGKELVGPKDADLAEESSSLGPPGESDELDCFNVFPNLGELELAVADDVFWFRAIRGMRQLRRLTVHDRCQLQGPNAFVIAETLKLDLGLHLKPDLVTLRLMVRSNELVSL